MELLHRWTSALSSKAGSSRLTLRTASWCISPVVPSDGTPNARASLGRLTAAPTHWIRSVQDSFIGCISVAITEIADAFTDNPTAAYAVGSSVRVVILHRDTESYVPETLSCETRKCGWHDG